ncbi:MAG: DegT/DnrJ/EryC1/StrS family aminotransferase [bacterium]
MPRLKSGGTRRRYPHQIGVGTVLISPLQKRYVADVLRTARLSYGPYSAGLERKFAEAHARRFAVFCNSGTSALQVAVDALLDTYRWKPGDEVLVPAATFIATSNVVLMAGLRPVFVDIDPLYYEIDPAQIERHITRRTRAIMPVHLFGQPCDMRPILEIARRRRLRVLEDSCEAMFVKYRGAPVGSWGEIACFSTYAAHLLTTGVGGLACTNDKDLAVLLKSLCNHGRDGIYTSIDDDKRLRGAAMFRVVERRFSFVRQGYSYRATELEAALGLAQLKTWRETIAERQRNAAYLTHGLRDLEDRVQLPAIRPHTEHAFMMYPIVLRPGAGRKRDLVFFLEDRNVETRDAFPLLSQPFYRRLFGPLAARYPVAQWVTQNGFYVGCHPGLTRRELDFIIEQMHAFFRL